jgi:hypothetical protein
MIEPATTHTTREPRLVACSDCGESFVARGIAAHRRMKHGVREIVRPASVDPAVVSAIAALVGRDLAHSLGRIVQALERIDGRIAALELRITPAGDDGEALEAHLQAVINEIERVKSESAKLSSTWGGRPQTEEQRALEQTTFMHLGTLRRQQAKLLFDLQDLKGEPGPRVDCIE